MTSRRFRYVACWLLFGALLAGAFEPHFVTIFFSDLSDLRQQFFRFPDVSVPSYPYFLTQVRHQTEPGSTIALLMPMRKWDDGYAYAYYRASYFLTGRRVIPLVTPDDRLHLDRLDEANYVAAWKMKLESPQFDTTWTGFDGRLEKRVR